LRGTHGKKVARRKNLEGGGWRRKKVRAKPGTKKAMLAGRLVRSRLKKSQVKLPYGGPFREGGEEHRED